MFGDPGGSVTVGEGHSGEGLRAAGQTAAQSHQHTGYSSNTDDRPSLFGSKLRPVAQRVTTIPEKAGVHQVSLRSTPAAAKVPSDGPVWSALQAKIERRRSQLTRMNEVEGTGESAK